MQELGFLVSPLLLRVQLFIAPNFANPLQLLL